MPPKGASTAVNPIRLQTVSRLKIRNPDKHEPNPCLGPMTAMLSMLSPLHCDLLYLGISLHALAMLVRSRRFLGRRLL